MNFPNHGAPGEGCAGACCLRVDRLCVKLEEDTILQDISFHLHCGEMVALIGPNGAGKTSLFQSILGQIPYTGKITFERPGTGPSRPLIGYVPQSPAFDSRAPVSVLDFFAAAISPWPVFLPVPISLRTKVQNCLDRVQGGALLDKRIGALSGGELQRVLLAMALEPLPQILILDEPLSGVDVEGEHQLMELLQSIRREYDLSILFSTHDFQTLPQYADRVMLLHRGLRKIGGPAEVLQSPEFRAAFHLGETRKGGWSV
ncbi:MAG: transporter ATP-binding protein [Firmicutes bacterium]|nr:transporter ATP-binding protein [Bacillota bacterium]